jgi:hypothetical protein
MLRVERTPGAVLLVSRLTRAPAVGVLAGVLLVVAVAAATPAIAAPFGVAALLVLLMGGRAVRARFERGRVSVRHPLPLRATDERLLSEFSGVRVESVADARRRKAERLAHEYRAKSGGAELPSWMTPPVAPGVNDHLRRVVLVGPRSEEPLAVTAWLADEDLEAVRAELEALLR